MAGNVGNNLTPAHTAAVLVIGAVAVLALARKTLGGVNVTIGH